MRKGDITMPSVVALAVTVVILLMAMIYFSNVQQAINERIPYEKYRDSVYTAQLPPNSMIFLQNSTVLSKCEDRGPFKWWSGRLKRGWHSR